MYKTIKIGKRFLEISTNARRSWNDARLFKSWNSRHFVWWKLSIVYQWDFNCEVCQDKFDNGCQHCCDHSDSDFHCCLNCGAERDYGAEIDAAEYQFGDR